MKSAIVSLSLAALFWAPLNALGQGVEDNPTGIEDMEPEQDAESTGPAWLGIMMEKADNGVRVSDVIDDSPASKSGVVAGDVIVTVGDADAESPDQITRSVRGSHPGAKLHLVIERDQKTLERDIELDAYPGLAGVLRQHFVGKAAPELTWTPVHSPDTRKGLEAYDRPIVVEFWATWCMPCKPMHAYLGQLSAQVGTDVAFVAVSSEELERIKHVGARKNAAGDAYIPIAHVKENVLRTWIIEAYPTVFVIDADGRVAGAFTGLESREEIGALVNRLAKPADDHTRP